MLLGLLGNEARPLPPGSVLLSSRALGAAVGAGNNVFWLDVSSGRPALYGYNVVDGSTLLVSDKVNEQTVFASDGRGVIYTQSTGRGIGLNIMYYDLSTRQTQTITGPLFGDWSGISLALDNMTMFYTRPEQDFYGLFARNLASGEETLISKTGFAPVARDGKLLWTERTSTGSGAGLRTTISIRLRFLANGEERTISTQENLLGAAESFSYDTLGDSVVWALGWSNGDMRVFRYQPSNGATAALSSHTGFSPRLDGSSVVWADAMLDADPRANWTVVRYQLGDGSAANLTPLLPSQLNRSVAVAGGKVATTLDNASAVNNTLTRSLYLIGP